MLSRDEQRLEHILEYCKDIAQTTERFGNEYVVFHADKAYHEEHGKDPDEVSENVPRYYLKADANACLNKEGARMLLGYYQHLLLHDSLAVSQEELLRMERLVKEGEHISSRFLPD